MPSPYYEDSGITIYHGDARDIIPSLTFDSVITDPPYGIDAAKMTMGAGIRKRFGKSDWDAGRVDLGFLDGVGGSICVWGGNYYTDVLPPTNDWLVWHKKNDGRSFSECELAWTNFGKQTRILAHHWGGEQKRHATQKPLAVMRWCVGMAGDAGVVLDPFMGSGTTLRAAKDAGLTAIGIELDEASCEIAASRLAQGVLPFGGG